MNTVHVKANSFLVFIIILSTLTLMLGFSSLKEGTHMSASANGKTVYLIDGSGFLYRAYYGLRPLHTAQGVPVQAVYSFCRMIKKLIEKLNPDYMALIWDSKGKTVRHTLFPAYKATRTAAPSDLFDQRAYIQKFADLIGIKQFEKTGVEADDLIYSLAQDYNVDDTTIIIISSDKDLAQLLSERVKILDPFKEIFVDHIGYEQEKGIAVTKIPFYFSLVGDSSDNIPGVKGIGSKTALNLVQNFDSLQDLYERIDQVPKEGTRRMLLENKSDAFLSYDLFLLRYFSLDTPLEDLAYSKKDWIQAKPLFEELNFKTLLKDLASESAQEQQKVPLSILKGYQFLTITTAEQLQTLVDQALKAGVVAIDTELDGLNPLESNLVGFSFCFKKGEAYYVPCGHKTGEPQLTREQALTIFQPIMRNPQVKTIMHSANFDQRVFMNYSSQAQNLHFDTLIAAHLVTQDWQKISLKSISEFYLGEVMLTFSDVVTSKGYKNFAEVPLAQATEYAASDAHQTFQLYPILKEELVKQGMEKIFYDVEFPLVTILCAMEYEGIYCDKTILTELDQLVVADLQRLKQEIVDLSGCAPDINLNSPKQIEQLLFSTLKLEPLKKSSKKTGYSTDVEVLQTLAKKHPVPHLLVNYRELSKLKSTYIDALPTYINQETNKIHTTFSQTAVATGRLASYDPNLQNVPTDTRYHMHIRSAFKPDPGHIFLSADYSQIELRVLAYFSQDKNLVDAFLNDQDIHNQTASRLFDVAQEQVTPAQRQIGKRINFSILYGLTPYGLSKDLDIPFKEAQQYIQKYFDQYPNVRIWMEEVIRETKDHGYVTTLWGRKRYLPGIYEQNKMLYDLARRVAINTKAQGTAAEIMKRGMINLENAFKKHNLKAKMILQIHDELLIQVPLEEQEKTTILVKEVLEQVVTWNIPLKVTTRFGTNWQEVTK